ncbi:hypothetical protein [Polyangium mundeleinium]|uniref:Uncharacterized protein n=1 Tax=Polyangium mundeleinium TaxID=2995306 RepID=A0ABT5EXJ8_9BACT|nr:hypothetical protein [Polyangium mundeleinium]MDC0746540.1 hypothetical protein [Polyangium mundeleinium]
MYSYASADIDAPAHAVQFARVVPELAARHLGPWLGKHEHPKQTRSLLPLALLGAFAVALLAPRRPI